MEVREDRNERFWAFGRKVALGTEVPEDRKAAALGEVHLGLCVRHPGQPPKPLPPRVGTAGGAPGLRIRAVDVGLDLEPQGHSGYSLHRRWTPVRLWPLLLPH